MNTREGMSSGGGFNNQLALTSRNRWPANTHGTMNSSTSSGDDHQEEQFQVPWMHPTRPSDSFTDEHPWRVFEERVRTGPYGLSRFPLPPHSPIRILILDESFVDSINPGLRRFIENSPPRIRGQWESQEDPTGLTQDEFKEVMKKLRKQTYNPTYPKNRARRRGLFSSRKTGAPSHQEEEGKEEAKDCTICLETFISNQTVLVTPCNHMFHNDCLMPWIKNHGECPFCRFKLCERRRERVPPPLLPPPHHHNNDNASVAAVGGGNIDNITAGELLALIT